MPAGERGSEDARAFAKGGKRYAFGRNVGSKRVFVRKTETAAQRVARKMGSDNEKKKLLSRWSSEKLVVLPLAFAMLLCTVGIGITLYETTDRP